MQCEIILLLEKASDILNSNKMRQTLSKICNYLILMKIIEAWKVRQFERTHNPYISFIPLIY